MRGPSALSTLLGPGPHTVPFFGHPSRESEGPSPILWTLFGIILWGQRGLSAPRHGQVGDVNTKQRPFWG